VIDPRPFHQTDAEVEDDDELEDLEEETGAAIGDPQPLPERELEVVPPVRLKSRQAIAELERRGQPVNVLREKVQTDYRSPWEGRPREGFTAEQQDRAVKVLSKEKAAQGVAGKIPGHTEQYHR